jgi:hypothetical protein
MSLAKFDKLMSHLNSEENEMGAEFRKELKQLVVDADKLACLEAGGVDNWDFYHDALRDNNWIGLEGDE